MYLIRYMDLEIFKTCVTIGSFGKYYDNQIY